MTFIGYLSHTASPPSLPPLGLPLHSDFHSAEPEQADEVVTVTTGDNVYIFKTNKQKRRKKKKAKYIKHDLITHT